MRRSGFVVAALLAAAGACNEAPTDLDEMPLVEAVEAVDAGGPIFRRLDIALDRAAAIEVEYWTGAGAPRLLIASPTDAADHSVFLPRLRSEAAYAFEVYATTPGGTRAVLHDGTFETGTLPPDLSAMVFYTIGVPTHPLTMVEVRSPTRYVIVDAAGEVVWYWPEQAAADGGFTRLANGDFVFLQEAGVVTVTPRREEVARLPDRRAHHDVIVTPSNTVLFLALDDGEANDTVWSGEAIWEWDPATGTLEKRWTAFGFLSPAADRGGRSRPDDWLHGNSLAIGPRGNVIVSFFWLPQVISIAPDYQSLEWRLGGPNATVDVEGGAIAGGQHTASEVDGGRVLLFDNGADQPDGPIVRPEGTSYSRALELELDVDAGMARVTWDFRPRPDIFAPVTSSAYRLENGNTLVAFGTPAGAPPPGLGFGTSEGPIAVYEVTPTGRIVWFMRVEGPGNMYRATALNSVGSEEVVPTPLLASRRDR